MTKIRVDVRTSVYVKANNLDTCDPRSFGDVVFIVAVKGNFLSDPDVDPDSVIAELKKLDPGIGCINYLATFKALICVTTPEIYSKVFSTTLQSVPNTRNGNLEYKELSPSVIPPSLAGMISSVLLNRTS